jgi:hypothetical protein
MATVFVRTRVNDYKTWRGYFDDFAATRRNAGSTGDAVYQSDADPNEVVVVVDFASMDAAKAFAGSEDLRQRMQESGVVGAPDVWFTNRV